MKKMLLGAILVAAGLSAVSAKAADADRFALTLTPAVVSDYRFRGISQSDTGAAAQLGIDGGFKINDMVTGYLGLWGSNVDFNNNAKAELDMVGGFRWTFDKLSIDTGLIHYEYIGATDTLNLNFNEVKATAAYDFGLAIPSVGVYYSPNFQGDAGTGVYTTAGITIPLPVTEFEPKIVANVGHQSVDKNANYGVPNYTDWNVGLFATFFGFTAGIQYVDTNLSKRECMGGQNWCEAGAVFSVGYTYAF